MMMMMMTVDVDGPVAVFFHQLLLVPSVNFQPLR